MAKRLVVLDFDGTCTDVEAEGIGFTEAVIKTLVTVTQHNEGDIRDLYERFERRLHDEPGVHGMRYGDKIVAPAMVDPYLRSGPIAKWVLETCGIRTEPEDILLRLFIGPLYRYHYGFSSTALRPELEHFLETLTEAGLPTVVVTNSDTTNVRRKLMTLQSESARNLPIYGDARKFVLGDLLDVSELMHIPGLERPIYLRRPHYFAVLRDLLERYGIQSYDDVIVIGDIYELDLALPDALGCHIGLMVNAHTPEYELQHLKYHPRSRVLYSLTEALNFIC